jgi:hypothetical protein
MDPEYTSADGAFRGRSLCGVNLVPVPMLPDEFYVQESGEREKASKSHDEHGKLP